MADLEAAYAPFVASLLAGGFAPPADGWPAELVAAHVAGNNDLIAETAERIIADPAARARALAEDDPAVRAGLFTVRAMGWLTGKGVVGPAGQP